MTPHEANSFHAGRADGESFGRALVELHAPKRPSLPNDRAAIIAGKVRARGWASSYYAEGYITGLRQAGVEIGISWDQHLERLRLLWLQDAKDEIDAESRRRKAAS